MNTSEIQQNLKAAYEMVKNLNIEEPHLQQEAFKYALSMLAGNSPATNTDKAVMAATRQGSVYEQIAQGLDIPVEVAELFYDLNGGELALNIPAKVLPDGASAAMREIAVLLAVGRKHAGISPSTSYERIRKLCDDHGRLDKKNFAAILNGLKPRLTTTGKGSERELVPKRPADEMAREILTRYSTSVS